MTYEHFLKVLGQNIYQTRFEAGLTQQQLADRIGVHVVYLCKVETASAKKNPSLKFLWDLTEELNVTLSWLCEEHTKEKH